MYNSHKMMMICNSRRGCCVPLLLLLLYGNLFAQNNLLLNGELRVYNLDSVYLPYLNSSFRIGVHLPHWSNINSCHTLYDTAYSKSGGPFLSVTYYQQVAENDVYIANVAGALCRPLLAGSKYRVSLSVKPYTANFAVPSVYVAFAGKLTETYTYLDTREKSVPCFNGNYTHIQELPLRHFSRDSFYSLSFTYTATGGERYMYIGNLVCNKPTRKKSIPPFGYIKKAYSYSNWNILAVSGISVIATDNTEGSCPGNEQNNFSASDTIKLNAVLFGFNAYQLLPAVEAVLQPLVKELKKDTALTLYITGFTDTTGSENYNRLLSMRRAEAVFEYLLKSGINENRMHLTAGGESCRYLTNEENRFVQIIISRR